MLLLLNEREFFLFESSFQNRVESIKRLVAARGLRVTEEDISFAVRVSEKYALWILYLIKDNKLSHRDEAVISNLLRDYGRLSASGKVDRDIFKFKSLEDLQKAVGTSVQTPAMRAERGYSVVSKFGAYDICKITTVESASKLYRSSNVCVKDPRHSKGYLEKGPLYLVRREGRGLLSYHDLDGFWGYDTGLQIFNIPDEVVVGFCSLFEVERFPLFIHLNLKIAEYVMDKFASVHPRVDVRDVLFSGLAVHYRGDKGFRVPRLDSSGGYNLELEYDSKVLNFIHRYSNYLSRAFGVSVSALERARGPEDIYILFKNYGCMYRLLSSGVEKSETYYQVSRDLASVNAWAALEYAKHVGSRVRDIEGVILTNSKVAAEYALLFLDDPEVEFEKVISKSSFSSLVYANKFYSRWDELSKEVKDTVLVSPASAVVFAGMFIKNRFPEGEEVIKTDPISSALYAGMVLKSRWPEAEETILRNVDAIWLYLFVYPNWEEGREKLREAGIDVRTYRPLRLSQNLETMVV